MTLFRTIGRRARGPLHQAKNLLERWLRQDLRAVVQRRHGHPVRLLLVRLLETSNVLLQVGAVALLLAALVPLAILGIALFFFAQQMRDVWEPLP